MRPPTAIEKKANEFGLTAMFCKTSDPEFGRSHQNDPTALIVWVNDDNYIRKIELGSESGLGRLSIS
jgi:hypothetical protein